VEIENDAPLSVTSALPCTLGVSLHPAACGCHNRARFACLPLVSWLFGRSWIAIRGPVLAWHGPIQSEPWAGWSCVAHLTFLPLGHRLPLHVLSGCACRASHVWRTTHPTRRQRPAGWSEELWRQDAWWVLWRASGRVWSGPTQPIGAKANPVPTCPLPLHWRPGWQGQPGRSLAVPKFYFRFMLLLFLWCDVGGGSVPGATTSRRQLVRVSEGPCVPRLPPGGCHRGRGAGPRGHPAHGAPVRHWPANHCRGHL
jgi:hypothetical protein